ncbi:hypothetical protein KM043_007419 [Ampulex compressa]|nr:hypothetical protein KM043_007419 [Ampulex compressa]
MPYYVSHEGQINDKRNVAFMIHYSYPSTLSPPIPSAVDGKTLTRMPLKFGGGVYESDISSRDTRRHWSRQRAGREAWSERRNSKEGWIVEGERSPGKTKAGEEDTLARDEAA